MSKPDNPNSYKTLTVIMGVNSPIIKCLKFCIQALFVGFIFGVFTATHSTFVFLPFPNFHPPPCPMNEVYKQCVNNCSNCEQRGICPMTDCQRNGCDCINRFIRLTPDGPCEPISKCPALECGENEVFRECGPICERCGTLRCRVTGCDHRCYCKEGFLRDFGGKCIPEEECITLHCPKDTEELLQTGPADELCVHAEGVIASNETQDVEQCYCKEGFKRSYMGNCVPEANCPRKCLGVEEYLLCPKKCDTTCRNYGDPTCEEDGQCYPGCFCPNGYVMNDFRYCVLLEQCPPGSNPFAPTVPPPVIPDEKVTEDPPSDIDIETASPKIADEESTITIPEEEVLDTETTEGPTEAVEVYEPDREDVPVEEDSDDENERTTEEATKQPDSEEATEQADSEEVTELPDSEEVTELPDSEEVTELPDSEEAIDQESTETPIAIEKSKPTKRTKTSSGEKVQKTELEPTTKNIKSKKVADPVSDSEDQDE